MVIRPKPSSASSSPITAPSSVKRFLVVALLPASFASGLIANLVKEHLARPQAALIPGFRRPHIVVALSALALVVLPFVVLAPMLGVSVLGAIAVLLGVVASMLWLTHAMPSFFVFFLLPLVLVGSRPIMEPPDLIKWMLTTYEWADVDLVVACVSMLAIAGWARRLMRLNEEMFEYGARLPLGADAQKMLDRRMPRTDPADVPRRLKRLKGYVGERTWDRVQLWRLSNGPAPPWVDGVVSGIVFGVVCAGAVELFNWVSMEQQTARWIVLALLPALFPILRVLGMLDRRLADEALRPSSKSRMLRELGLGLALDTLYSWVGAVFASFLITAAWLTDFLTIPNITAVVLYSFGATCFYFGLATWLAHFRWRAIAPAIAAPLIAGDAAMLLGPRTLLPIWMALALVMVCAGVGFARLAHHAWCEKELG